MSAYQKYDNALATDVTREVGLCIIKELEKNLLSYMRAYSFKWNSQIVVL